MRNFSILQRFILGVFIVFFTWTLQAQVDLVGTPYYSNKSNGQFQESFNSYNLFQIETESLISNLKNNNDLVVKMSIGKSIRANVVLFENDLFSSSYSVITDGGENLDIDQSLFAKHFEGYILDDPTSEVRLSIAEGYIYGYIQQNNQRKYIEPASTFDKKLANNTFVVYSSTDVKISGHSYCAATEVVKKIKETNITQKSAVDCGILDIAVALDNSYVTAHTNNIGAINQSTSVLNMVEPNYSTNAFSKNLKFSIVQHFIPSGSDPWTSSADAAVLLDAFTSWGGAGFTATHDIGEFWTNRDLYFVDSNTGARNNFVAGLAWVGTVCGGAKYHILEDFSTSAWQLRVLTSHEMGHNFGSDHDATPGDIMAGSITINTNSWSSQSIGTINAKLAGYNCFDECFQGSCSSITSVSTSDCTVGLPPTYTLTIEVTHGGGAAGSNGFNVLVDGGTYFQPWNTSPQTIIIEGLSSDGTINHPIAIAADNGSDEGCNGTSSYNEPAADCSLSVFETFDNCQKPIGWSTATTLNTPINSGDPLVQYQWKFLGSTRTFGNYASYSNASTTKTLNGTCMAIMDDDIFSSSGYSGTVTMETPSYDVTNYQSLVLEFEYLFHPFEDGGKGANNSYFRVEVWDGVQYVSILNDQDSNCPWSNVWTADCRDDVYFDVTSYLNSEFKVKFTYSDGGAWAGMAVVDNFKLNGIPAFEPAGLEGDCDEVIVVSGDDVSGEYSALGTVITEGEITIEELTIFEATEIEFSPDFTVEQSVQFTVRNGDCGTF